MAVVFLVGEPVSLCGSMLGHAHGLFTGSRGICETGTPEALLEAICVLHQGFSLLGKEAAAPVKHNRAKAGWQHCVEQCFPSQTPIPEPGIAFSSPTGVWASFLLLSFHQQKTQSAPLLLTPETCWDEGVGLLREGHRGCLRAAGAEGRRGRGSVWAWTRRCRRKVERGGKIKSLPKRLLLLRQTLTQVLPVFSVNFRKAFWLSG